MVDPTERGPRTPTFRAEALAHRGRRQEPGGLIKLSPGWTRWSFYGLLTLFIAGLVASAVIDIDRYAQGPTVTDAAGRIVVLIPAALAPEVTPGSPVELGSERTEVISFEDAVLYPAEVKERFGIDVAVPSVAVTTSAAAGDGAPGSARVLVQSEPIIVAVIPGLSALFGGPDG